MRTSVSYGARFIRPGDSDRVTPISNVTNIYDGHRCRVGLRDHAANMKKWHCVLLWQKLCT